MRPNPLLAFAASGFVVTAIVFIAMSSLASFDSCRTYLNDDHPARESLHCQLYVALGVGSSVLFITSLALVVLAGIGWLHRRLTERRG